MGDMITMWLRILHVRSALFIFAKSSLMKQTYETGKLAYKPMGISSVNPGRYIVL